MLGYPLRTARVHGGLRYRDVFAPRSGVACGAIGLRMRMMRLCAANEYIHAAQ